MEEDLLIESSETIEDITDGAVIAPSDDIGHTTEDLQERVESNEDSSTEASTDADQEDKLENKKENMENKELSTEDDTYDHIDSDLGLDYSEQLTDIKDIMNAILLKMPETSTLSIDDRVNPCNYLNIKDWDVSEKISVFGVDTLKSSDGLLYINGKYNRSAVYRADMSVDLLEPGIYTLSYEIVSGSVNQPFRIRYANGKVMALKSYSQGGSIVEIDNSHDSISLYFSANNEYVFDNTVIRFWANKGTTAQPYARYDADAIDKFEHPVEEPSTEEPGSESSTDVDEMTAFLESPAYVDRYQYEVLHNLQIIGYSALIMLGLIFLLIFKKK